jgi:phosphatidylglycerophosphate synthase
MNRPDYEVGDRRPLASRDLAISKRIARWLASSGATPNVISVVGMFSGIAAGALLAATPNARAGAWLCWIGAAACVQLRLLANLFDGMVALATRKASPVGELFNEVPDRISDAATLLGLGYAAGSNPLLGWLATCLAIFTAYLRAMGKVAGAHQEFCGPMAKPQRMATVTLVSVVCAVLPMAVSWRLAAWALALIAAGTVITAIRRLNKISAALRTR